MAISSEFSENVLVKDRLVNSDNLINTA